ncbi:ferredoxin [Micromonospora sp. NPDC047074]|uniref:ferredoxin n=1 Tax=Micromonospora sp. NPDC047074 TaxID=3154339 RepID=UPI003410B85C
MAAASASGSGDQAGWRLTVDSGRCVSSGFCAGSAPDHFKLDDVSRPLADLVAPDEAVVEAANYCPVEAILVSDARTGTRIAPQE